MRSVPQRVTEVFKKIPSEKMLFQVQKYEKHLKSKNDIKRPLGPFNKELLAIQVFLKLGQFLKPSTHGEKRYNNQHFRGWLCKATARPQRRKEDG